MKRLMLLSILFFFSYAILMHADPYLTSAQGALSQASYESDNAEKERLYRRALALLPQVRDNSIRAQNDVRYVSTFAHKGLHNLGLE